MAWRDWHRVKLAAVQGTPESNTGAEGSSLAMSVDKDGKPLPEDTVAAKHLNVDASKPKKAAPTYIPQGPLKSKYHVQVGTLILPFWCSCCHNLAFLMPPFGASIGRFLWFLILLLLLPINAPIAPFSCPVATL